MACTTVTLVGTFTALHCALASEFVLPQKSPTEVAKPSMCILSEIGFDLQVLNEAIQRFLLRKLLHQSWGSGERRMLYLESSQHRLISFLRGLLSPFIGGVWVVCHHLLSLDGGVQSLSATIKAAQQLSAKCLKHGNAHTHIYQQPPCLHYNFPRFARLL